MSGTKKEQLASGYLWRPFSLTFDKEALEQAYLEYCRPSWHTIDCVAHFLAIIVGPALTLSLKDILPTWYILIWLGFSFGLAPVCIYFFFKHRSFTDRHRMKLILFLRLGNILAFSGFGFYLEAPEATVGAVMKTIMTKTATPNMFFTALMHRVPFKMHMMIHSLALLEALLWIQPFCNTCSGRAPVMDIIQRIGTGIDGMFSLALLGRKADYEVYPCWMVSSAVIIFMAYIIPTFLIFVADVLSRLVFLQSTVTSDVHETVKDYTHDAFRVAMLGLITAGVFLWFLLSLIRDHVT